jgi:histone H3/H4
MTESENINLNLDRVLKELLPKNIKISQKAFNLIKMLCQDIIKKISSDSGFSYSIFSKNILTQEDILQIISKSGLNRYITEIDEEIKRYNREEVEVGGISK